MAAVPSGPSLDSTPHYTQIKKIIRKNCCNKVYIVYVTFVFYFKYFVAILVKKKQQRIVPIFDAVVIYWL
jgi:hypothetical protein